MMSDNSPDQQAEFISLIKSLVYNFVGLIFQHIKLVKEEFKERALAITNSVVLIGIAACLAHMAVFFLGVLLIVVFSIFVPIWASLLIVTFLYSLIPITLLIYAVFQFKNIDKKHKNINKEIGKTMEETKRWVEQLKS